MTVDPVKKPLQKETRPIAEPFSTTLVIDSIVAVAAVVGLGLLVNFKKRHR
jgi:hypothetical protein